MYKNWLNPTSVVDNYSENWTPNSLGHSIQFLKKDTVLDMNKVKVVILGIGDSADEVRRSLYSMSNHFKGLSIVDLGNFKKKEVAFIIPLLKELYESDTIPMIIGDDILFFKAQYRSFKLLKEAINVSIVDKAINISPPDTAGAPNYLDDVFYEYHENIFHLDIIGNQIHYSDPDALSILKKHHFNTHRLGQIKANISIVEPIVRDADLFSFHIASIKQSAVPSQKQASSSGFSTEEACRICRYAGMSDKLRSFGVFGYQKSGLTTDPTPETIAQMVWYFLLGVHHRKSDFPISFAGMVEYIVQLQHDTFTFWKSSRSERWWIQIAVKSTQKNKRHRLVPCTYEDYELACKGKVPDRLIEAIRRFT